jgi:hypothetical protein
MFSRDSRRALGVALALALLGLVHSAASAQTGTVTGKVTTADGKPLAYANVVLVGTTMGAMTLPDGKFTITAVPPRTYTVKAMMMGYKAVEKPGVVVNIGATAAVEFKLETTVVAKTQEIVVVGERALVEVTESKVTQAVSDEQLQSMPVDDVLEAVGLKAGIVKTGDDMHVRGGRSGEVQVQIDGVPVSDPLGGGSVDVGMLGTSGSEIVSGGMDAEYGDAQSAVINIATKEGGRRFGGEMRYFTDDFGRSDKTYTNFDRLSLGFGGPTWWDDLRYYVSGEATWSDTENTTIEPRPEHKITDFFKFRQRQQSSYNMQGKLTYNMTRMKLDGEAIYTTSRSDDYVNNWNISGYVGKIWYFQALDYAVAPDPNVDGCGRPVTLEIMEFGRIRGFSHGPRGYQGRGQAGVPAQDPAGQGAGPGDARGRHAGARVLRELPRGGASRRQRAGFGSVGRGDHGQRRHRALLPAVAALRGLPAPVQPVRALPERHSGGFVVRGLQLGHAHAGNALAEPAAQARLQPPDQPQAALLDQGEPARPADQVVGAR